MSKLCLFDALEEAQQEYLRPQYLASVQMNPKGVLPIRIPPYSLQATYRTVLDVAGPASPHIFAVSIA